MIRLIQVDKCEFVCICRKQYRSSCLEKKGVSSNTMLWWKKKTNESECIQKCTLRSWAKDNMYSSIRRKEWQDKYLGWIFHVFASLAIHNWIKHIHTCMTFIAMRLSNQYIKINKPCAIANNEKTWSQIGVI